MEQTPNHIPVNSPTYPVLPVRRNRLCGLGVFIHSAFYGAEGVVHCI